MIKQRIARFLKISCPRCGSPAMVYSRATMRIKCKRCKQLLLKPTGGKTKIKAQIKQVIKI